MRIVILSAGLGTRLGQPGPKSLTVLSDGRSILQRQLDAIEEEFQLSSTTILVGFKKELIMDAAPMVSFAYNPDYGDTNTSKSLLRALEVSGDGGVLWMNGDVVLEAALLSRARRLVDADRSFVCVNTEKVGEEEVKYRCDENSNITVLSKTVDNAAGEAVGINYVSSADKQALIDTLRECDPQDYFERGIELAIERHGSKYAALEVGDLLCIEVDFPEDLAQANGLIDGS